MGPWLCLTCCFYVVQVALQQQLLEEWDAQLAAAKLQWQQQETAARSAWQQQLMQQVQASLGQEVAESLRQQMPQLPLCSSTGLDQEGKLHDGVPSIRADEQQRQLSSEDAGAPNAAAKAMGDDDFEAGNDAVAATVALPD
jgi:hypothetical protein